MRYLIDGHNLIAKLPDIALDDPNDEALLVLQLRSWVAAGRKRKVTVIFDGGLPGGRSRFHSTGGLEVIFAPESSSADALLIRRIKKARNPAEYVLISSDQQVIDAAHARRMKHITTDDFAGQLSALRQPEEEGTPPSPAEADNPAVSQDEVDEWLALFEAAPKVRREAPKPKPRKKPEENAAAGKPTKATPAAREQIDPAVLKSGAGKLSGDEVDEWLKLFDQGE